MHFWIHIVQRIAKDPLFFSWFLHNLFKSIPRALNFIAFLIEKSANLKLPSQRMTAFFVLFFINYINTTRSKRTSNRLLKYKEFSQPANLNQTIKIVHNIHEYYYTNYYTRRGNTCLLSNPIELFNKICLNWT